MKATTLGADPGISTAIFKQGGEGYIVRGEVGMKTLEKMRHITPSDGTGSS